jgi:RNA polymerase sigma factor (sigma-70 family)
MNPVSQILGTKPNCTWSDGELVEQCLRGNESAWSALVDKYKNLVYSVPLKYRLPSDDAADVFQGVWTDLFTELPKLRNVGALRSWLVTVAAHKSQHRKRLLGKQVDATLLDSEVSPQTPLDAWREDVEREQMLREAMVALSPRCQRMITMLFFSDPPTPYADVARQLGLAEGSIGFIRGRCLKKLRDRLQELGFSR